MDLKLVLVNWNEIDLNVVKSDILYQNYMMMKQI